MPQGAVGFRWQKREGQWNLEMKDGLDGSAIDPVLSIPESGRRTLPVSFIEFAGGRTFTRNVPVLWVETAGGSVPVATVFDLLLAHYGVNRGFEGEYPQDYDDETAPYTPAWQEKFTGVSRATVIQMAREWAITAEKTRGKCTIIVVSGINHWYHSNLNYRTGITALILCGCIGVNGGGLNHYTGQEKVAPAASWTTLAMGLDWVKPPRLQNAPSFHYVHGDQWHYERTFADYHPPAGPFSRPHAMDQQADAVRMGWLPFYPQFDRQEGRPPGRGSRLPHQRQSGGLGGSAAKVAQAASRRRRPGRTRELVARLAHLARKCDARQRRRP